MDRTTALSIAKIAYKEISHSIQKWESIEGIDTHWDGYITVGEYLFTEEELIEQCSLCGHSLCYVCWNNRDNS